MIVEGVEEGVLVPTLGAGFITLMPFIRNNYQNLNTILLAGISAIIPFIITLQVLRNIDEKILVFLIVVSVLLSILVSLVDILAKPPIY